MNTNTDPVRALIAKWRLQAAEHGTRTFTGNDHAMFANELEAALAASPPSAPVGVEELLADLETIWHSVSDDKETNAAYERLKIALAQQPAAPSGEAVAYRWRDRGTMQMVYSDTNPGYCNVEHLYTAPQQPAAVDEAVMRELMWMRGRWGKGEGEIEGMAVLVNTEAKEILAWIDRVDALAAQQQGGRADG